jgi:hypothetical protein
VKDFCFCFLNGHIHLVLLDIPPNAATTAPARFYFLFCFAFRLRCLALALAFLSRRLTVIVLSFVFGIVAALLPVAILNEKLLADHALTELGYLPSLQKGGDGLGTKTTVETKAQTIGEKFRIWRC